ncbi:uncharacterized protein LOC101744769 [Bombyx mori]|uniref:Uncharacterized protein n=1 Tax=Bombyx mori TaxID=7091 RepID=A0A8R1WL47_BOMMO|nr:uncharacterized protein LOC101744769 [Bombyx mori]
MKILPFLLTISVTSCMSYNKLLKKAASVCDSVFYHEYVTSVVWMRTEPEDITLFLQHFHGSAVIVPLDYQNMKAVSELNKATGFKQTVLFAVSVEEFILFITTLNLDLIVPIRMVLVLTTQLTDLAMITKEAWKHDLAEIIIISKDENEEIRLTTYFPYKNGICGDYTPHSISNEKELFPEKFKNLHGCPIKVTLLNFLPYVGLQKVNGTITFIFGIDGSVFILLIKELNAIMDIVSSTDHGGMGVFVNGSWKGSFGDIVRREADIFAPAGIITQKRFSVAQMSHTYETLNIHWCAPPRREIYAWAKVLLPFLTNITPFLVLAFTVFVITIVLVKRSKLHGIKSNKNVFLQSFMIFLGQGVKFETKSSVINSFFVAWLWFCLIVRIAYQGDLVNGLQKKIYEPPFESVEQALQELDGYGGTELFREYYAGSPIADNYQVIKIGDLPRYIRDVIAGKRFLIATDILMHQYAKKFQILQEPLTHSPTCLFMRPGWPVSRRVDVIIIRAIEAGLVQKIIYDFHYTVRLRRHEKEEETGTRPLGMSTMFACYYGLILLWIFSFVIFLFEVLYYNWKHKIAYIKRKRNKLFKFHH